MTRPGLRLLAFFFCAAALQAGEIRRPVPAVRINQREYIRIEDVATRLKADLRWIEAGRQAELTFENHRLVLSVGGRYGGLEMTADGLNVFLGDPVLSRSGELYVSRIDLEQRLVPLTHWGWGGEAPPPPRTIVIDPGHGGDDSGAKNPRLHLMEKTFTLDTALRLQRLLEAQGWKVVLTRTSDRKLDHDHDTDLRLRGETAVAARADLFLSIHFDAGPDGDTRSHGTEVYTFPPQHQSSTDDSLRHVDSSEPSSKFPDAAPATREDHWSVMLAHAIHRALIERLRTEDRGEKLRHLGVLRPLDCPGILVEPAFLSNDAEARRIADSAFRQQIAGAIAAGIQDYARELDTLRPKAYENAARPSAAPAAASASAPPQPLQKPTRPSSP
ncbi:MAG TPA: N-acetylmuramoyl-L-alanine amidase [Opitutaceae bacterium]|jgi:N-acetylmuramoyl-L-alanine amidase|nr:N-acetylmuramoyl-L-alanine amidase [Opitutaceae bacterium]